jgi:hypothetical protein
MDSGYKLVHITEPAHILLLLLVVSVHAHKSRQVLVDAPASAVCMRHNELEVEAATQAAACHTLAL